MDERSGRRPDLFVDPLMLDFLLPIALQGNCQVIAQAFESLEVPDQVREALFMRLQFILTGHTTPIRV